VNFGAITRRPTHRADTDSDDAEAGDARGIESPVMVRSGAGRFAPLLPKRSS